MTNYQQIQTLLQKIHRETSLLNTVGISISKHGEIQFRCLENRRIADQVSKIDTDYFGAIELPFKWNLESMLALQIAEEQEIRNGWIDPVEISHTNKFFDVNITKELIGKVGSYFI